MITITNHPQNDRWLLPSSLEAFFLVRFCFRAASRDTKTVTLIDLADKIAAVGGLDARMIVVCESS